MNRTSSNFRGGKRIWFPVPRIFPHPSHPPPLPSPLSQAELEDLSFAVLYPEEHARVAALVRSRQDPAALEALVATVKAGLEARGIQYEDISGRPKNLYGLWQKMQKDGVQDVDKVRGGMWGSAAGADL